MLVLSRRSDQQVVFPNVGITLNVLKVRGQVVKLGIEAPDDVEILRPEAKEQPPSRPRATRSGVNRHDFRGRINNLRLALAVFDRQRALGRDEEAEQTFQRVIKLLSELDAQLSEPETKQDDKGEASKAGATGLRLLVVEDDANERELLAGLLRLYGYDVTVASDGVDALKMLEQRPRPDIMLLDINMPNCGGMEVVQRIRSDQRFANLPVYAVSGADPGTVGVRSDLARLNGWFPKPIDPARLLNEIRTAKRLQASL